MLYPLNKPKQHQIILEKLLFLIRLFKQCILDSILENNHVYNINFKIDKYWRIE